MCVWLSSLKVSTNRNDLRYSLDWIAIRQSNSFDCLERRTQEIIHAICDGQSCFTSYIDDLSTQMEELHQHTQELSLVQHQTTRSLIEDVVHERNYDRQHQSLLDALAYPTINHRHDEIAEAHLKTYGWIFARPPVSAYSWSDFVSFLQNPGGIYWITGKPGSGKSTLMKFILEDKRFHDVLDSSSDEGEIITASFFAWSSGAELQKSLESMLRSLIYEMVDKCSKLLPKLYGREYPLPRSWTLKRLESMFNHIICQTGSTTRFVLIIDGLDELSGDLDRVIDYSRRLLRILMSSSLCRAGPGQYSRMRLTASLHSSFIT